MDSRDAILAVLVLCFIAQYQEKLTTAINIVWWGFVFVVTSVWEGAQLLWPVVRDHDWKRTIMSATSEMVQVKRAIWYRLISMNGLLGFTREGMVALYSTTRGECSDLTWGEYMGLASLFLTALLAVLFKISMLQFVYKIICHRVGEKIDWAGVRKYAGYGVVATTCGVMTYISPESLMTFGMLYGYIFARQRAASYNPFPMPTLDYAKPDTNGILVSDEVLMPPLRNVGGNEMAIPGVQTNKTDLTKAPFAFLICSDKWSSVIGMGFRTEIDGKDVLVTVLHVHSGWAKTKGESEYMHIYGKNGRAKFKPEIVLASRALDLVYYKYPSTIGEAGVTKGKYINSKANGCVVWVLSPAVKGDDMLESSCASMRSYAPYHFSHWASTRPGSSGSPVYTKDGIIGVHRGSDGIQSNYGVFLFSTPRFASARLETSAPNTGDKVFADFTLDDYEAQVKVRRLRELWADDEDIDNMVYEPASWMGIIGESAGNPDESEGREKFTPPGMNPTVRTPWFLDVYTKGDSSDARLLFYPVGFNGRLSVGRPLTGNEPITAKCPPSVQRSKIEDEPVAAKSPENSSPAQTSSPALGITVGSSGTDYSSSPSSARTSDSGTESVSLELEKQTSNSQQSGLTLVLERICAAQAQMVLELRALKEPQPSVKSSTDGVPPTGVQVQSIPPSSIKPGISKRAQKRAKANAKASLAGCSSTTPAVTEPIKTDTSKCGAA